MFRPKTTRPYKFTYPFKCRNVGRVNSYWLSFPSNEISFLVQFFPQESDIKRCFRANFYIIVKVPMFYT